jgi:dihydroxyacetone kinase DhaKLM complex PTS-EIIA-like component DhaM
MSPVSTPRGASIGSRLAGKLIGVSVSVAPDLAQLGFPRDQLDRVLEAVLAPLLADGARIVYGGQIKRAQPGPNFTQVISAKLGEAYRRMEQKPGERPFVHFLAQYQLAETAVSDLVTHLRNLAPYGELWITGASSILGRFACIEPESDQISLGLLGKKATEAPKGVKALRSAKLYQQIVSQKSPATAESLTHLREQMAQRCDARVLVGGAKSGFSGSIPGLCQEALLTIKAGQPLLCLGGFGGVTRDIAAALGLIDKSECVPREPDDWTERYEKGLALVHEAQPRFDKIFTAKEREALRTLARTESVTEVGEGVAQFLLKRLAKSTRSQAR